MFPVVKINWPVCPSIVTPLDPWAVVKGWLAESLEQRQEFHWSIVWGPPGCRIQNHHLIRCHRDPSSTSCSYKRLLNRGSQIQVSSCLPIHCSGKLHIGCDWAISVARIRSAVLQIVDATAAATAHVREYDVRAVRWKRNNAFEDVGARSNDPKGNTFLESG